MVKLSVKKKQQLAGISIISVIILLISMLVISSSPKRPQSPKPAFEGISGDKSEIEDVWLIESKSRFENLSGDLKTKDYQLKQLQRKYEELEKKFDEKPQDNKDLENRIDDLNKKLDSIKQNPPIETKSDATPKKTVTVKKDSLPANYEPFARQTAKIYNSKPVNRVRTIAVLSDSESKKTNAFDPKEYLPAGSYAKAEIIEAVDASTGISAQSDPRPVLFRIKSDASSAQDDKKRITVAIKGCTVTGAASGDISSERVFVRLLKMSCKKDDKVIETNVEGHAADSDGKAGIAGRVVSREGDLVTKSFLAGAVSGVGRGASQKFYPSVNLTSGFTANNNMTSKDIAGLGLSEGISQSSENIANFFLERAKQYEPVVSISAGKMVELVFISGVYLDGRIIPQNQPETNSNNNQQNINNF